MTLRTRQDADAQVRGLPPEVVEHAEKEGDAAWRP
jgi:hypothetical protein